MRLRLYRMGRGGIYALCHLLVCTYVLFAEENPAWLYLLGFPLVWAIIPVGLLARAADVDLPSAAWLVVSLSLLAANSYLWGHTASKIQSALEGSPKARDLDGRGGNAPGGTP